MQTKQFAALMAQLKPVAGDSPDMLMIKRELRRAVLREIQALEPEDMTKPARNMLGRIRNMLFPN